MEGAHQSGGHARLWYTACIQNILFLKKWGLWPSRPLYCAAPAPLQIELTLCMYGSTLASIIRCHFIIYHSDIFLISFVIDDVGFRFPPNEKVKSPQGKSPRLGNTVLNLIIYEGNIYSKNNQYALRNEQPIKLLRPRTTTFWGKKHLFSCRKVVA